MLPFTTEQFYAVFAAYNAAIWPVALVAYGLGLMALGFLVKPGRVADRAVAIVLGLMWLWTGVALPTGFTSPRPIRPPFCLGRLSSLRALSFFTPPGRRD
jgi:hypothetical protein